MHICDGGRIIGGVVRAPPATCQVHPLGVKFNPANDLNQPQLLFLRVEEAQMGVAGSSRGLGQARNDELIFSKQLNQDRKHCIRILKMKSLVGLQQKTKHTFEIVVRGEPPIRLEAHDAFVRAPPAQRSARAPACFAFTRGRVSQACAQWVQLLHPMIESSQRQQVDLHAFPARMNTSVTSLSPRLASNSSATMSNVSDDGAHRRSWSPPRGAPLSPRPSKPRFASKSAAHQLQPEAGIWRGWIVNTGQAGLANLRRLEPLPSH
jgi:hypothetical protein